MKILSGIFTTILFTALHNHSTTLVKAIEWEYPEEKVNLDGTDCPCFSITNGLHWANSKLAGFPVDIHRRSSCFVDEPKITINYAYLHRNDVDETLGFHRVIDGVIYNHLSATYDTVNEKYECSREDTVTTINAKEAHMCHNLLKSTCQTAEERICPCYSMSDLVQAEERILDGNTVIDASKSCVTPTEKYDKYGIYEIGNYDTMGRPCDGCTTIMFAVQNENVCFDGSDIIRTINMSQKNHCYAMMQNMCSDLDIQSSPDMSVTPACNDDAEFREEGIEGRDCKWVSEDSKKRCNKYDDKTGRRVFEFCRMTCDSCACRDDGNFRFNGISNMDCDWVAQDVETRCALHDSIRKNCIATCSSDCCKDNENFNYLGYPSLNCEWVSGDSKVSKTVEASNEVLKKRNMRCMMRPFAANCPETCGMCPQE